MVFKFIVSCFDVLRRKKREEKYRMGMKLEHYWTNKSPFYNELVKVWAKADKKYNAHAKEYYDKYGLSIVDLMIVNGQPNLFFTNQEFFVQLHFKIMNCFGLPR
jgi:hypothetical protein